MFRRVKSEITTFVKFSICLFREILHSLSGGGIYSQLILFPDNLLVQIYKSYRCFVGFCWCWKSHIYSKWQYEEEEERIKQICNSEEKVYSDFFEHLTVKDATNEDAKEEDATVHHLWYITPGASTPVQALR